MNDKNTTILKLKEVIKKFVDERNWEKYHSPKNLSMSLSIESAELMEIFQWLSNEDSLKHCKDNSKRKEVEEELADIAIYLINFCNILNINLSEIVKKKLNKNSRKYPVNLVKGKAHKYTYYKDKK